MPDKSYPTFISEVQEGLYELRAAIGPIIDSLGVHGAARLIEAHESLSEMVGDAVAVSA